MHIQFVIFIANPHSPQQQLWCITNQLNPTAIGVLGTGTGRLEMARDWLAGGLRPPAVGEIFFFWAPQLETARLRAWWAWAPSPLPGVPLPYFPPGPSQMHQGSEQRRGWGLPAPPRTTGPHELVCSHCTAFTGEKKPSGKFPACRLVLGKSKGLFLGNIDIKAGKKREQGQ